MSRDRTAQAIGWAVLLAPVAILAACAVTTADDPPRPTPWPGPVATQQQPAPTPLESLIISSPYGPADDCGDGTIGTFAECSNRNGHTP